MVGVFAFGLSTWNTYTLLLMLSTRPGVKDPGGRDNPVGVKNNCNGHACGISFFQGPTQNTSLSLPTASSYVCGHAKIHNVVPATLRFAKATGELFGRPTVNPWG